MLTWRKFAPASALLERPSDVRGAAAAPPAGPAYWRWSAAAASTGRPTGKIAILRSVGCCWCDAAAPARQQTRPRALNTKLRLPKATQLIFPHKNTTFTTRERRSRTRAGAMELEKRYSDLEYRLVALEAGARLLARWSCVFTRISSLEQGQVRICCLACSHGCNAGS